MQEVRIFEPYIVIGIARSGTSTVAGVLHNDLHVHMGYNFPEPDENNPDGYFEDGTFKELNKGFVQGRYTYKEWFKGVWLYILDRHREKIPWGFKNIRLASLLGFYLQFFDNPKIIWCQRDPGLVVKSHVRCFGHKPRIAEINVLLKTQAIKRLLADRDHLVIDFGKDIVSRETIAATIRNKWN